MDGKSDNRANSAQFQLKLPTGAELGKNKKGEREKGGKKKRIIDPDVTT